MLLRNWKIKKLNQKNYCQIKKENTQKDHQSFTEIYQKVKKLNYVRITLEIKIWQTQIEKEENNI